MSHWSALFHKCIAKYSKWIENRDETCIQNLAHNHEEVSHFSHIADESFGNGSQKGY
jgi:hypothetical protein